MPTILMFKFSTGGRKIPHFTRDLKCQLHDPFKSFQINGTSFGFPKKAYKSIINWPSFYLHYIHAKTRRTPLDHFADLLKLPCRALPHSVTGRKLWGDATCGTKKRTKSPSLPLACMPQFFSPSKNDELQAFIPWAGRTKNTGRRRSRPRYITVL